MRRSNELTALAFLFSLFVGGCTADATDDAGAASGEDELTSLAKSEVVGSLTVSWYPGRAAAPAEHDAASYRAWKFDGYAGQKLAAYLVTNNETTPIAYILDARFRMLKRKDGKDAALEFTPPENGTYYLAFRTKERTPATVMARIVDADLGGLKTKTFADGWPLRARNGREDAFSYEQHKHAVLVSASVEGGAISITNASSCPPDPFHPGAGLSVPDAASFTVDPVAKTVTVEGGLVSGSGPIAADGTFTIDSGADRWGFKRARGRVAAGGFVIVDHVETETCSSNYAGATVHDAHQLNAAIGAADPNYR